VAAGKAYEAGGALPLGALPAGGRPVGAMVPGVCIGGGLALGAGAALGVAADDARLALPAARLGLGYHFSGVARLVEIVGTSAAAEIFFTARQYTADEALRIGLLNQVVPGAELESFTARYAGSVAANAPPTHRAAHRPLSEPPA